MDHDAERVKIDLHCHSTHSDGDLEPEMLAERIAATGARVAALTDHNAVSGIEAFRARAGELGMRHMNGLEVDIPHRGLSIHVLCYGFGKVSRELGKYLGRGRQILRYFGFRNHIEQFIRIAHDCGALTVFAHPLAYPGVESLEDLIAEMKEDGIDGLEAYYSPYEPVEHARLLALARSFGLFVTGGSDYHRDEGSRVRKEYPGILSVRRAMEPGIEVPAADIAEFIELMGARVSG
jgi:predicted metal-dependent phosphoesterase TrpH